jgi:hypothetical protein
MAAFFVISMTKPHHIAPQLKIEREMMYYASVLNCLAARIRAAFLLGMTRISYGYRVQIDPPRIAEQRTRAGHFIALKRSYHMTRDELITIVKRSNVDTLIAQRFRDALGLRPLRHHPQGGRARDKSAKARKYRNAKHLMAQRYGVRL